jgi:hypothetical protein
VWNLLSVRPKIAELVFQLYGRSLHPELFEVCHSRKVERNGYSALIQITNSGHLITWQYDGLTLTEVATAAHPPLPIKRRLMCHRLKGAHNDHVECRGGITYDVEFSLEHVDQIEFQEYLHELALAGAKNGLFHCFEAGGRFGVAALSYIHLESRDRSFVTQVFHTFPDDQAIIKSRSVFRLPK